MFPHLCTHLLTLSLPGLMINFALQGYYQALTSRYRHFKGQPQQQAKLVELVLAALQQRPVASHEASPAPSSLHTGPLSTGHTGPLFTGGKLSPAPRLSG